MELKYKNYRAVANPVPGTRFDLFETRTVRAEKDTKTKTKDKLYSSEHTVGYSYTFESMLKKIAQLEVSKNENIHTIQGYIVELKRVVEDLKQVLNEQL